MSKTPHKDKLEASINNHKARNDIDVLGLALKES